MTALSAVTNYLDEFLRTGEIDDYPNAVNGLQLENSGEVHTIVAAVDAVEAVMQRAGETRSTLLIVHHGLFWPGLKPVTRASYRKLKHALDHDLAIYSSHLPLDLHAEVGNSIGLFRALGFSSPAPFFFEKGNYLGVRTTCEISRAELVDRVRGAVGGPVHVGGGGPEVAAEIGIVTGGAGAEIYKAAAEGVDTFITGEGPHWSFTTAEELGVNILLAGHYATETFGVKALAAHVASRFNLPWHFLDHPTGL